jgi:hypothetical protein
MNAPKRWKEPGSDVSPELRSILEYAGARAPDAIYLATLTDAALAQVSAPTPALAAASAAKASSAAISGKLLGLALSAALAGAGGAALYLTHERAPEAERAVPQNASAPPSALAPAREAEETPASDAQSAAPELAQPEAAAPTARVRSARMMAKFDEFELLQRARLARSTSQPRAIALLRQHERSFPDSHLREERDVLMIELLSRSRPAAAAARAVDFMRRFPNSPYRARVMRLSREAD